MISNSCKYAIRAVIYIAEQPSDCGKTGIKKISGDLDLPTPFLAKILQQLAKHKILISLKGPHGGFSLLKEPDEITLLDIVKIVDGEDIFERCIMCNTSCSDMNKYHHQCHLHDDYDNIRKQIIELFSRKTIYDLVKKAENHNDNHSNESIL